MSEMLPRITRILLDDAAVSALVGERIYGGFGAAPKRASTLSEGYVTWHLITATAELVLDEAPSVDEMTIQVDCWGRASGQDASEVLALAAAVRTALDAEQDTQHTETQTHSPEVDTGRLRCTLFFTVWLDRD